MEGIEAEEVVGLVGTGVDLTAEGSSVRTTKLYGKIPTLPKTFRPREC